MTYFKPFVDELKHPGVAQLGIIVGIYRFLYIFFQDCIKYNFKMWWANHRVVLAS